MLVLSRKWKEKVFMVVPPSTEPVTVEITVVDIDRGKIRLGVSAPREVAIYREEVLPLEPPEPTGEVEVPRA